MWFRLLAVGGPETAVQEAIRSLLESYGLDLRLVDRGFDYEVALRSDNALEEAGVQFEQQGGRLRGVDRWRLRFWPG